MWPVPSFTVNMEGNKAEIPYLLIITKGDIIRFQITVIVLIGRQNNNMLNYKVHEYLIK